MNLPWAPLIAPLSVTEIGDVEAGDHFARLCQNSTAAAAGAGYGLAPTERPISARARMVALLPEGVELGDCAPDERACQARLAVFAMSSVECRHDKCSQN